MDKKELILKFDQMQEKYGSGSLCSVYGGGEEHRPRLCLVFINPTARNIATSSDWTGIRFPWLGIKQVWRFLTSAGLFSPELNDEIQKMSRKDWSPEFCELVYKEVAKNGLYITNLAKCTQDDARPLPDRIFKEYRDLFLEEIRLVDPRKIILFGNQVSSIILNKKISVNEYRRRSEDLKIGDKTYKCFPVYYPVGNGFFNAPKAVEDLRFLISSKVGSEQVSPQKTQFVLKNAQKGDKNRLIGYKLETTITETMPDFEKKKITKFVFSHIPTQINSYKLILVDEKIVGCLRVVDHNDGVLIDEIFLEKNYRNMGIGSSILRGILAEHRPVYLWVYKSNTAAKKLYARLGFKTLSTDDTREFMQYKE